MTGIRSGESRNIITAPSCALFVHRGFAGAETHEDWTCWVSASPEALEEEIVVSPAVADAVTFANKTPGWRRRVALDRAARLLASLGEFDLARIVDAKASELDEHLRSADAQAQAIRGRIWCADASPTPVEADVLRRAYFTR